MKVRLLVLISLTSLIAVLAPAALKAQGVVIPIVCDVRPCQPRPVPGPLPNVLPVRSIELTTRIVGQVATTHVEQVFRNDTQFTLEGTYFFPIPENASISEFAVWENGKRLAGEVRSREEARRIYDEIVRRQRDPGLLEYAGKDLFQASIFPIGPLSDKKLEITYTQVLKAENGTVGYRYPLGTGRNLWTNTASRADDYGDGRSGSQQFGTVSGTVEIDAKQAIRNVYSPTHHIETKLRGETSARVTFETKGNNADFQLYYGLSDSEFGMSLITHREPGKDGYFLLTLSPKQSLADRELVNKDIIFVLDTSGSMSDAGKMDKARNALLFGIRTLRDGDRFNVINFAGEEHLMESRLIRADAAGKKRGEDFVEKLQPNGGTNINDSLIASLKQFESGDRPKMLVFMTDGLPTVGETSTDRIITNLRNAKKLDIRIFPFGFGYDVNTTLLDRLGAENSGISDYVQPQEDLEVKVSNFFSKVSSPVLSDLELDFGPLLADQTYPRKLTDLFKGMQLTITGRYRNTNELQNVMLRLNGKGSGKARTFEYRDLNFPQRNGDNEFLPRLWATRRVGWLLEQIRANGESKETRDEVVALGTKYGLVTPYTSYLATDGTVTNVRADAPMAADLMRSGAKKAEEKSGAGAVRLSVQQNSMQTNVFAVDGADKDGREQILIVNSMTDQFIGNKNFTNASRTKPLWIDSEFSAEDRLPEVYLKFASESYFQTVAREPEIAQYFALGRNVVVVWKGTVYRITE